MKALAISGSPSAQSKTRLLAKHFARLASESGVEMQLLDVRDLPARHLLSGDVSNVALASACTAVAQARAIVVATPIYKAAYSGLLKVFLDLLPQTALQGKTVLPVATGGSPLHALAIDYALRPVLQSLGAPTVLQGIFVPDGDCRWQQDEPSMAAELAERVQRGVAALCACASAPSANS